MTEQDWSTGFGRAVAVFLNDDAITDVDPRGEQVRDDSFLLCFRAHHEPIDVQLPAPEFGVSWRIVLDTGSPDSSADPRDARATVTVGPRAFGSAPTHRLTPARQAAPFDPANPMNERNVPCPLTPSCY